MADEIIEQEQEEMEEIPFVEVEPIIEPIVYKKQENPDGKYKDKKGKRYDILTCRHTESMEWVQTGSDTQVIDGEIVEVPVMEQQVVVNKGWDSFETLEDAEKAYGLTEVENEEL